jgi:hypothetical protein
MSYISSEHNVLRTKIQILTVVCLSILLPVGTVVGFFFAADSDTPFCSCFFPVSVPAAAAAASAAASSSTSLLISILSDKPR